MGKMAKRIIAVILTVCSLLTVMIPAAFAVTKEDDGTLKYTFGSAGCSVNGTPITAGTKGYQITSGGTSTTDYAGLTANIKTDFTDWCYLYHSQSTTIQVLSGTTIVTFSKSGAGHFIAMQIMVPKAGGTYELTFGTDNNSSGGLANVYIVDAASFTNVKPDGFAGSGALAKEVIDGLTQNGKVINASNPIVLDSVTSNKRSQNVGAVTFPAVEAEGDYAEYVLLFQGLADLPEGVTGHATRRYMRLQTLTMTPVVATVGDQSYTDADSAVAAIAGAASGTNVTINSDLSLSEDLTTEANITVAPRATLDLAGKDLTAVSVNTAAPGAAVIDSADGVGLLKTDLTADGNNGGYLPLTDSTAGGYRLCKPTLETLGKVPGENGTAAYWFHAHFEKEAAYGYTGVEIGVQMTWDGGSKGAWAGETFMGNWATQVKADKDLDIKLTVTGLDNTVTNFKLTPVIQANGVTISMNTL